MAKFTASHYEAIAKMIGITLSEVDSEEWSAEVHLPTAQKVTAGLTNRLIDLFEEDNERFDRTRFIDATGQQSISIQGRGLRASSRARVRNIALTA